MDYGSLIGKQDAAIQQAQNAYNQYSGQATGAQSNLSQFQKTQKSASDLYSGAEAELGVQGARDTASRTKQALNLTQGLINNLPGSVTGRTQGSLVSEAQRQRLLANEMQPLTNQYNIQGGQYSDQQNALNALLGQAAQKSGLQYQSQTDRYNQLNDIYKTLLGQQNTAYGQLSSAQEMRNFYLGQQESVRQFNEQLAESRRQADIAAAERASERQLQITRGQEAANRVKEEQDRQAMLAEQEQYEYERMLYENAKKGYKKSTLFSDGSRGGGW